VEDRATAIGNIRKNLVKIGRVVPEIWSRTDKHTQTHRQTRSSQYCAKKVRCRIGGGTITTNIETLGRTLDWQWGPNAPPQNILNDGGMLSCGFIYRPRLYWLYRAPWLSYRCRASSDMSGALGQYSPVGRDLTNEVYRLRASQCDERRVPTDTVSADYRLPRGWRLPHCPTCIVRSVEYIGRNDVTESMVTIGSPFCGNNTT